jgi:hypothetical protein
MKIQTSRESHRTERRYSGVYQQQGRMITDADWNELMEIVTELRRESLGDVVQSGIPRDGGIKITLNGGVHIAPGHLYAGGILARLPGTEAVSYSDQPDFPDEPALPDPPYKLYADVWERTLTSLEDDGVRDAALHGADTCARTQTMVQVKWCHDGLDPEDPALNPSRGDAPLTLTLRHARTVTDPCDPCAAEELGDDPTKVGNYLFRLEVHDVRWDPQQQKVTQLTLKWSSENGAEHYALGAVPEAYQLSDWAYELYNDTTERHLGVHVVDVTGFPHRGKLSAGYPIDLTGYQYVRRWDGFVVLDRTDTGWSMDARHAVDRGLVMTQVLTATRDGEVVLTVNSCAMNLKGIAVTLELDRVFVAGDYWTAPVREAVDAPDSIILENSPPAGIVHRYLTLGLVTMVNGTATLTQPPELDIPSRDAARRRLDFPSLTTLMAKDVGLTNNCEKLYGAAQNVQDALDKLCDIEARDVSYDPNIKEERWKDIIDPVPPNDAPLTSPNTVQDALDTLVENLESSDIRYSLPACSPPEGSPPTFEDLVKDLLPPSGDTDLKSLWDALLCHLDAARIPYDPASTKPRWTDITDPGETPHGAPNTVQDAIDTIVDNLESSDIGYNLPTCGANPGEPPLFKDLLALPPEPTNVKKLWDEVLCRLSAATVPVDKTPPLKAPLDASTVRSVQDALNVLAGRGGRGGLASILEALADAIGIMPDDPRRKALMKAPVSGEQSLAEATYGMVVDLLRIAAAFALEYIDLKGVVITPDGELRIGTSASVSLLGTIRPEARAFGTDQIRARTDLWAGLKADFKNVFWCVLAEFLASKRVEQAAVEEMGRLYGSDSGYNGPAARLAFLENVYKPLFGTTDLDHTTLATLRALVLEFLALLWQRVTIDVLIHEPPAFSACPTNMQWLQSPEVQRVWNRVRDQDGLMRFHPTPGGAIAPAVTPRLSMERVGQGSAWIARDDSIERYLHPPVVEPLLPAALRQGARCPEPSVILQCLAGFRVGHAAPAVYGGSPALEVLFANLAANAVQLTVVDVAKLPAGGPPISAPANLPLLRKPLTLPNDCHMVLGDGRHSPIAHRQRQFATSATGEGMESIDLFLVAEDPLNPRMLYTESGDGVVLAVYHLTAAATDPLPSHAVLVESSSGRQRLILLAGNGTPWWSPGQSVPPPPLRSIAHVALHPDVTVAGVAHDQLVLQVVQPGSAGGPKWTFVPFRTFAESLWGQDRVALDGFWNTAHPDGAPLFESLDGSVTPTLAAGVGDIAGTPLFGGILAGGVVAQPAVVAAPPPPPGMIVGPPPPGPIAQPLGGRPLPLFDGVVRRTGPAGLNGWLTVLAEDEVLGLYQTFQGLLPRQARRYHVNHAGAALATVVDNLILIGDVTDQALQFDLGSMVKA